MKNEYYRNYGDLSGNSVVTDLYNKRANAIRKKYKKNKWKNYKQSKSK